MNYFAAFTAASHGRSTRMSTSLSALCGNESLKQKLHRELRASTLSHAYIVEGRRGFGKHTLARSLAAALSCEKRGDISAPLPCGTCNTCRKILEGICPDVLLVTRDKEKATLGVDVVREIRSTVSTVPSELDKKVYIIEDADLLTVQAQNALLLTLEEPPPFVVFFLLCENARALLETIRSRAPVLRLEPLSEDALHKALTEKDPRARITKNTQPEEYAAILTAADGSLGEAIRLLDPKERKSFLQAREITMSVVECAVRRRNTADLLATLSLFPPKRPEAIELLSLLRVALRDLVVLSKDDKAPLCFYTDRETALTLAEGSSLTTLLSIASAADRAIDALLQNANLSLTLVSFATEATGIR